jgi:hypothetical protein
VETQKLTRKAGFQNMIFKCHQRHTFFRPKMHHIVGGWGFAPDPAGQLTTLPRSLVGWGLHPLQTLYPSRRAEGASIGLHLIFRPDISITLLDISQGWQAWQPIASPWQKPGSASDLHKHSTCLSITSMSTLKTASTSCFSIFLLCSSRIYSRTFSLHLIHHSSDQYCHV